MGLSFTIKPSHLQEDNFSGDDPVEIAENLALQKATRVAENSPGSVVIGADTLVILDGEILGKPKHAPEAGKMLQRMSGRTHIVVTGVCLLRTNRQSEITNTVQFHERTKVTFATLSPQEIESYVTSGNPMDKAGAYGIQDDWGAVFVSRIEGDYYNIVGFPLHKFYQHITSFAPEVLTGTSLSIQ